jgi:methyl-accepting chemotaxis protein
LTRHILRRSNSAESRIEILKLEIKLGLSTGFLIAAALVSAVVAHVHLVDVAKMSHEVDGQRGPFVLTTGDLHSDLADSLVAAQALVLYGTHSGVPEADPAVLAKSQHAIDHDVQKLQRLETNMDFGTDQGRFDGVVNQVREIEDREREAVAQVGRGTPQEMAQAHSILRAQALPVYPLVEENLDSIVRNQSDVISGKLATLDEATRAVLITLWTATILGAIVGGVFSLLLARRVARGIVLVSDRAKAIASGDLTGAPLKVDSSDEIGSLASAMQQMERSLSGIIHTVKETAGSLTTSAGSMSSATEHIHLHVDQQTQQTQQAATAMQEMSASIAEVSRHTQSAAETARSAAETAHEGGEIVARMLKSMHSIARAVSETSSTMGLLGEDSRRISQIVTVIDEIATKTNLLALNAAIEAARAGEHGRGFAVVAGEVRHLAERTAQATSEIATMINGIQERTRIAVASMESGTTTVEQGVVTTNQAGEALERIIGIAERVDRMIAQIAIAASQQASSADQFSASLDAIHMLSNDNLSEMVTTTASIESLRATSDALESQVHRFSLGNLQDKAAAVRTAQRGALRTAEAG